MKIMTNFKKNVIASERSERSNLSVHKDCFVAMLLAMTVFSFLIGNSVAFSADNSGTIVMNSHGEDMELEFKLYDPGTEDIVDYSKYGTFEGLGTEKYQYKITNRKGLAAAGRRGDLPE